MLKKIVFLLSPKTHFLDLAGPDQVFFEAIDLGAPFQLEYCRYQAEPYTSSGLHFGDLKFYHSIELRAGDYLIIPGMSAKLVTANQMVPDAVYIWLRSLAAQGVNVCSVCTGAFLLGFSGLLNGKSCTTHWKYTQTLQRLFPSAKVKENVLYTEQEGIFTSAGVASGIDLALHILEKEAGEYLTHKVAREMVVYIRRSGNEAQHSVFLNYRNHLHTGVHQVQDWLNENLHKKCSVDHLATIANMSTRNFTRVFKKETGITVSDFIALLRQEKIKELTKKPDLSRQQIAQRIGLQSERQLRRVMSGRS
jgi:transcriptional regulator GlxA family with amidase domain